jgi:hypothetical protein
MNLNRITPARTAMAVAAAAVAGNLYLMLADALLAPPSSAAARFQAPSSDQAVRGRLPGEPKTNRDVQRWNTR